jgi:hypothetical protein
VAPSSRSTISPYAPSIGGPIRTPCRKICCAAKHFRKPLHRPQSDRPRRRDDRECGGPGERRVARWASRRVPHAALLMGMTVPPGRPGDDKASERRLRRVVETGQRSGEAGNSVGDATEQVQEAETRSREVHENGDAAGGGTDTAHGPTPEHLRRAAQLEERSYQHVQREKQKAVEARDRAVEGHYRAARLHDRQADLGWGNVEEHREQAHEHREEAAADSAHTDRDGAAHRDDAPEPPTPAGPDLV